MLLFEYVLLAAVCVSLSLARNPSIRQGGDACAPQPNYCMNGGTCFTQITLAPVVVTTTATTTTTSSPIQICMTFPPSTTTVTSVSSTTTTPATTQTTTTTTQTSQAITQTTTQAGTTTQYVYITQPFCGCQPQYSGDRCEVTLPVTSTSTPTTPFTSKCSTIQCFNGGTCRDISVAPFSICM